jgi:two-component system, OmpR family, phosphate regulon sensor histidine kinase PhoR
VTPRDWIDLTLALIGGALVLGAGLWMRNRQRLIAKLQVFAEWLAEGNEDAIPPMPQGRALAGLAGALESLGRQLTEVRSSETGALERARRLAEAVLEAMPDPVLVIDGEARVTRSNSAAQRLLGPALKPGIAAADLGNAVLQLAAEEASVGFPVASNQVPKVEMTLEGTVRKFRVRALPLGGLGTSGAILVLQDVSETEAEATVLRLAAQSALAELRPLIDGLGVLLLQGAPDELTPARPTGLAEWQAIDRILRDHEAAGADRPPAAVDLARLTGEVVEAVSLEAQRRRVKLKAHLRPELPAPQPITDEVAVERLLLRTLRQVIQARGPGDAVTVEVQARPRPSVRITPGLPASALGATIDTALLERAQAALLDESSPSGHTTILRFSQSELRPEFS